ncbi:MAG: hypothetical protein Q8K60_03130 [Parachlamydiaceae bacterium]|nr:hypothetical protein [Parachlamydiaceae bacterium]
MTEQYFGSVGKKIVFIDPNWITAKPSKLEVYNRAVREAWMRQKGIPLFHNHKAVHKHKPYDLFLGNKALKVALCALTLHQIELNYDLEPIQRLFHEYGISKVLGVSSTSQFAKTVFVSAQKKGLKTYYLVNSWKDLYINSFVPIRNFDKIFMWSEQMNRDYLLHCPYLKAKNIVITGNPSFDVYVNYHPAHSKSYYAKKYNLDQYKPWLYYTMMPPGLWDNEIEHIKGLGEELHEAGIEANILVRRNPNHLKTDFIEMVLPPNCTLTEHYVAYDQDKDLIMQTPEGEREWMDLVHHTDANMSIPSTVTLEFLVLNKPTFNLAFSTVGNFPESLNQHFDSGFYAPLFEREEKVFEIKNTASLIAILNSIQLTHVTKSDQSQASDLILKEIL